MAKAHLVSADMNASFGTMDVYSINFTPVERIRTGATYTYTLTYVSSEPFSTDYFPSEIDIPESIEKIEAKVEAKVEVEQPSPKQVTNAINQLEVSETVG